MRPSCYNRGHNILEICNILEKLGFTASKEVVDIKHKKHCIELPYKLPNDLILLNAKVPSYRIQSIDLLGKSIDWFLCDGNFGD